MFVKIRIYRIEKFLGIVNRCSGDINVITFRRKKVNIKNQENIQNELQRKYEQSSDGLDISLDIENLRDYFQVIMFSIGDC